MYHLVRKKKVGSFPPRKGFYSLAHLGMAVCRMDSDIFSRAYMKRDDDFAKNIGIPTSKLKIVMSNEESWTEDMVWNESLGATEKAFNFTSQNDEFLYTKWSEQRNLQVVRLVPQECQWFILQSDYTKYQIEDLCNPHPRHDGEYAVKILKRAFLMVLHYSN